MKALFAPMLTLSICLLAVPQTYGQTCAATIVYDTLHKGPEMRYWVIGEDPEIVLPRVVLANKEVATKINERLNIEGVTGHTVQELLELNKKIEAEWADTTQSDNDEWLDDGVINIYSEIKKNSDCVLSLQVYVTEIAAVVSAMEGAYPTRYQFLNFDLKTGEQIVLDSLIKKEKMAELLRLANKGLMKNYRKGEKEFGKEAEHAYRSSNVDLLFKEENLRDFYITDKGLYVYYDFHFFRCDQQWEPDNFIFISKAQLESLLRKHQYGL
ncbi:hypothetical protein [Polluticoccus soli]|uniref:hypothetical protein n=1 Tax=Polluticoccus soli TaxID=3034150 RepID=UPI0023E2DBB2|nr:hypothetical protein [Flavipsychrobacter sp. JY13-12]